MKIPPDSSANIPTCSPLLPSLLSNCWFWCWKFWAVPFTLLFWSITQRQTVLVWWVFWVWHLGPNGKWVSHFQLPNFFQLSTTATTTRPTNSVQTEKRLQGWFLPSSLHTLYPICYLCCIKWTTWWLVSCNWSFGAVRTRVNWLNLEK